MCEYSVQVYIYMLNIYTDTYDCWWIFGLVVFFVPPELVERIPESPSPQVKSAIWAVSLRNCIQISGDNTPKRERMEFLSCNFLQATYHSRFRSKHVESGRLTKT